MTIKETRQLHIIDLRKLCHNEKWYFLGTNSEYQAMLESVQNKETITTNDLVEIAKNIIEHSDNVTMNEITNVLFKLGTICTTFFEVVV